MIATIKFPVLIRMDNNNVTSLEFEIDSNNMNVEDNTLKVSLINKSGNTKAYAEIDYRSITELAAVLNSVR